MTQGFVYFVKAGKFIKIGYSKSPKRRMSELGTLRPSSFVLRLVGFISGTQADEKALHARFSVHRDNGEWFRNCDEIRSYIKTYCTIPPSQRAGRSVKVARVRRKAAGRPPILVPCPWCRRKFSIGDMRQHYAACPKKPTRAARA